MTSRCEMRYTEEAETNEKCEDEYEGIAIWRQRCWLVTLRIIVWELKVKLPDFSGETIEDVSHRADVARVTDHTRLTDTVCTVIIGHTIKSTVSCKPYAIKTINVVPRCGHWFFTKQLVYFRVARLSHSITLLPKFFSKFEIS